MGSGDIKYSAESTKATKTAHVFSCDVAFLFGLV